MCLLNLKSKEKVETYKKTLPKEFSVWKVVELDGSLLYSTTTEPKLQQPNKIYKARNFPIRRESLSYKPGFHAFRTKRQATAYLNMFNWYSNCAKLRKFKARREWITQIGMADDITCLVLSHIKTLP